MNSLVVSGLVLLVLLLLAIFWSRGKKGKALPYDLQETLFSPAERSFLGVLDLAVGDQARVFAKVRVADGQTIVIGGVYSTSHNNVVDKVPFFGDVPYVGRLFRRAVIQEKKSELLVFLTPRIMNNQAIAVSR